MRTIVILALVLAFPATASATGTTEVDLGGTAVERLRSQGVKLVAKRPARLSRGVLRLPVRQGLVGSAAYLNHSGALHLRKGRRVVRFTRLQTRLGAESYLNATARGRRIKLFTLAAQPSLNSAAGTASVRDARLTLTRVGARTIRRALKLRRVPAGRFGRATIDALVQGTTQSPGSPGGGGPPQSGPITDEPPVLTRPAGATDIASAIVTWHVRDSFVRYVSSGEGVQAIEGAAAGPAVPQEQHPCPDSPSGAAPPPLAYSYALPFAHGWRDGSRAAIYTTGGARFLYGDHGIDLTVHELEIELTGAEARVIARFTGAGDTNPGDKRAVLVNLAPLAGDTYKGTIPTGGSQSVFGGFYGPSDGFGCVTVSFSP